MTLLSVRALSHAFGAVVVASDIMLELAAGERAALIGPNGAGKTSFIELVTGTLRPRSGRVLLTGEDISTLPTSERVRRGLVRTFQITRPFPDLTVREHLGLSVLARRRESGRLLTPAFRVPGVLDEAEHMLADFGLAAMADRPARELAYGEQRMLELAVAAALAPKVLLLDEPASGVSRGDLPRIEAALGRFPPDSAILMIEHDMEMVFRFAARVIVLAAGRVIADGPPHKVAADPQVRRVYLGSPSPRPAT